MPAAPVSKSSKAKIIAEAVWATGGPESECLGAVKNHIDARHEEFPWTKRWHAEIEGTKAALCRNTTSAADEPRCLRVFSGKDDDDLQSTEGLEGMKIEDVQRAGEFVKVAGGDVEQAQKILEHLTSLDHAALNRLQAGLSLYSEILKAVADDSQTAGQVLEVLGRHFAGDSQTEFSLCSDAA